jgi:dTDP-4-dehydrorhamnose reductase
VHQRILLTGGTGLLAPFLKTALGDLGAISTTAKSGGDFLADLTDPAQTHDLIVKSNPDLVIHAAAWTDVDGCQNDPSKAQLVNATATSQLVSELPQHTKFVFISTDQVYPATTGPHREGTENPINVYGKSKLAGEKAALAHPAALIVRTSFFGPSKTPGRSSLSDFFAEKLAKGIPFTAFEDVKFSALHGQSLGEILHRMIEKDLAGTFNVCANDGMSKADFAAKIASHLGFSTKQMHIEKSVDQADRAPRILDLRMDPQLIEAELGIEMPTLADEIKKL